MINEITGLLWRFIVLTALQVLLLNNIQLSGFINPFLYVLFILLLPVKFPKSMALILAFFSGLAIDIFSNTAGMHASATVMMAYVRPGVLRLMAPREGYETDAIPSMRYMGFNWFAVYSAMLIAVHHLLLFFIEAFTFSQFFMTFMRAVFSIAASLLVVLIAQLLTGKFQTER